MNEKENYILVINDYIYLLSISKINFLYNYF